MVLLQFIAIACSAVFAGAALYISVVEHPARLKAGVTIALLEFRPSYARASVLQVAMIVLSSTSSIGLWILSHDWSWLIGGGSIAVSIPFTLLVIKPVNRSLLDAASPLPDTKALELLIRWGHLHSVRTITGLLGFAFLLARSLNVVNPAI
jgi:hypothetical protein